MEKTKLVAADAGEFEGAFDHAERGVAVTVHDPVREGTVVGADAHGAAEFFALEYQRGERFLQSFQFLGVLVIGVFAGGEFFAVGVVAGVDADFLDPEGGFEGGGGDEMDVGDDRGWVAAAAQFGDDVFEVFRVLDAGCGDAEDFAAGFDDRDGFTDAGIRVHRVGDQHRLDADRVVAADADVADFDFAGAAALPEEGIGTVVHGSVAGATWLVSTGVGSDRKRKPKKRLKSNTVT